MPVETQWTNYTSGGVRLFSCDMSAARGAGSLTRLSIPTNTDARGDRGGGVYDKTMSIVSQQPVIRGATTAVESLLDVLTADGMCVCKSDAPAKPGAQFYGQARETCGEDGAKPDDDAHTEYTVNWGHMRPETLSGSRGGDLELSFICDGLTDASGANAPIIINEAASLPPGLDLGRFSLGSMIVGDIILTDIMDMRLDFNVALAEKLPALASIWPKLLATSRHTPLLTLTGRDTRRIAPTAGSPTPTGRIAWLGTPVEKTNTQLRFRKRLSGDAWEPDDSNVHFEMHMKGMAVIQQIFDASGAARANTVINVFGIEDDSGGDNVPNPVQFAFQTQYSNFQPT